MEKINFSIAEERQLQEVFNIFTAAIEEMNKNNIPQWDEVYPDKTVLQNDIKNRELYIGTINGEIACAFVINSQWDEEYKNGKWNYPGATYRVIHRMCVDPKFQNQGIGTNTLIHIEKELVSHGVESIRLDAFSLNPYALKMYEKQGFVKVGEVNFRKGLFYLLEKKL